MSDEFKEFDVTPTLTFGVEEEKPAPKEPEKPTDPNMTEDVLSAEERQMVESFSKQIDIRNSAAILQYGVGTQKKMADFSEEETVNLTNNGFATWNPISGAGSYEVMVYRDGNAVGVTARTTTETNYNL